MAIIAIDYDDTYNIYPEEFTALRAIFQSKGHQVYIVTARNASISPIELDVSDFDKVIYTSGKAKASFVRADIWIDDNPVTLSCDFINGQPHAKPGEPLHQGYKDTHILWNWENDRFVSYIKKPFKEKLCNKTTKLFY